MSSPNFTRAQFMSILTKRTQLTGDNYGHLHEQPTVFYAIIMVYSLPVLAHDRQGKSTQFQSQLNSTFTFVLVWGYVFLRIVHSLWHIFMNDIPKRFVIFISSSLLLALLSLNAAQIVFHL